MQLNKYVARIEEACGENKDFIVVLKYDLLNEAINKILKKATLINSISNIIFDLKFQNTSLRLYRNGKIIIKKLRNKEEAKMLLENLLS